MRVREDLPHAKIAVHAFATVPPHRYCRDRALPLLIAVAKERLEDPCEEAARFIVSQVAAALRAERQRGRNGHWSYSLSRHLALCRAYAAERQRWRQAQSAHRQSKAAQNGQR